MQNILNHNRLPFEVNLNLSEYWDFFLYLKQCGGNAYGRLFEGCLATYIDTTIDECITDDGLKSMEKYKYSECISKGVEMNNIGFTGMDNGLIVFDKFKITPEEFTELLTKSVYKIEEGDCSLKVHPVDGNNKLFVYPNAIVNDGDVRCAKLNGGYFQGFYIDSDKGCDYKVLPNKVGVDGWSMEFELKRHDFNYKEGITLNDVHPENKGIFFYMGVRSENKWIKYYDSECEYEKSGLKPPYNPVDYVVNPECVVDECMKSEYYPTDYIAGSNCDCSTYFKDEYLEEKSEPEEKVDITETNSGHQIDEVNLTEIETENKFILFDRTCKGLTVKTYEEGDTAVIQYRNIPDDANYFTLFNRSCDGITVKDYPEYLEKEGNKYNINADLYKNAFVLQVRDDGSVGYKYLLKDCEAENPSCSYKIESEYTNPNEVKYDEWCNIHVRFVSLKNPQLMRIMIYVNGVLKLVSMELPKFDFRKLNDTSDKQEGVPFNISLGGGTQGLSDVIYNDYLKIPEYVYPLEKEFGGSFIGYFKSFKFYECSLNMTQLRSNIYNIK